MRFGGGRSAAPTTSPGAIEAARARGDKVRERPLSNGSINKTLKVLAQIVDTAIEYGYAEANPARGKRRRLKAPKPRRTWLEIDEARALLDAAGDDRTLLATMMLAGLRVSEAAALRWQDLDLARGKLQVRSAKTDAGVRIVDLSPDLLEELKLHRAEAPAAADEQIVFPASNGESLHRANISNRVLAPAVSRANEALERTGKPPIREHVTNHTLGGRSRVSSTRQVPRRRT